MINLASSNNRVHIRSFMHYVCQRNSRDTNIWAFGFSDFVENFGDSTIRFAAIGGRLEGLTTLFVTFFEFGDLFFCFVTATSEGSPRTETEAEGTCHWEDFSFKVTV